MKRNILKRKFGLIIALASMLIGFSGLLFSSYKIYAANLNAGSLSISFTGDQLFSESNLTPGDEVVKDISVKNNGTLPHSFSIATDNVSGNLAGVIQIEPRNGGVAIWNETLSSLASLPNNSKVILPVINAGETKNLQIVAIFPSSAENEFQGQSTANFDFVFGNESTDQNEPINNPSPPPIIGFIQDLVAAISPNQSQSSGNVVALDNQSGVNTPSDKENVDTKDAEGIAKGAETKVKVLCFWWLILLLVLIVFLYFYNRFGKNHKLPLFWLWPILVAVGLYFLQGYFDRFYQPTVICNFFWLFELVVLAIYYVLEFHPRFRKEKK